VAQAAGSSGSYTIASGATLGADFVRIGELGTFSSTNGAVTVANAFENGGIYSQTSGSLHSGSIVNSGPLRPSLDQHHGQREFLWNTPRSVHQWI